MACLYCSLSTESLPSSQPTAHIWNSTKPLTLKRVHAHLCMNSWTICAAGVERNCNTHLARNGLKTNCGTQTLLIKSESIAYLIDGDDDDCDAIMQ